MTGEDPGMEKGIAQRYLYRIINDIIVPPALSSTPGLFIAMCPCAMCINHIKTFLNLIRTSDHMWQSYRRNYVGLYSVLSLHSAYLNVLFHGCPNYPLQVFHLLLVKVRVPWNYIWNQKLGKDLDKNFTPTLPFFSCLL